MEKQIALQKMLKEMDGTQTSAEDAIHNFLCDQNDEVLFENIAKDNKSIKGAFDYCMKQVKKSTYKNGSAAMVPDDVVFGWVIDYFNDTKNTKAKNVKKTKVKPKTKTAPKQKKDEQLSLFGL